MTTATDTNSLASACWHITIDTATGEEVDRDMHEEWTLNMYHVTVDIYRSMLRHMGVQHLARADRPLHKRYTLSEIIHDNDIDLAWMMRDDGSIMGRNLTFFRNGKKHLIGIACCA